MGEPEKKYRAGQVSATVWKNAKEVEINGEKQNKDFYSVQVEKSYKVEDNWKTTNNFNQNDLPKLSLVVDMAYKYISMKEE